MSRAAPTADVEIAKKQFAEIAKAILHLKISGGQDIGVSWLTDKKSSKSLSVGLGFDAKSRADSNASGCSVARYHRAQKSS
jgi:hypothetical protein